MYSVDLLKNSGINLRASQTLEVTFDMIWVPVIDHAFISPFSVLHRKEKTSSLAPEKFDGLLIGGYVKPQEWVIIEVSRSPPSGSSNTSKQSSDREKLTTHCLRVLNHRRWYLANQMNLRGGTLVEWLRKFPVWGILCMGSEIEIVKLGWFTRSVGVVTTYVGTYPDHIQMLDHLINILQEVHYVAVCISFSPRGLTVEFANYYVCVWLRNRYKTV